MKIAVFLCCMFSIFLLISAVVMVKGKGDWMISNYRQLPQEQKEKINIFRLRRIMAGLLVFMAVLIPLNVVARTEAQHTILAAITVVGCLVFLFLAHARANYPLFINPWKK